MPRPGTRWSWALLVLVAIAFGVSLQGCWLLDSPADVAFVERRCKSSGYDCEVWEVCHSCCDEDDLLPTPVCRNGSSLAVPSGSHENTFCHTWCDDNCPKAVKQTQAGSLPLSACVEPSRRAVIRDSEEQFGRVIDTDRVSYARLRGGRKSDPVKQNIVASVSQLADDSSCMWRQTGGCNPSGPREPDGDKPCDAVITGGLSGYCECDGSRRFSSDCNRHFAFTCELACLDEAPPPALYTEVRRSSCKSPEEANRVKSGLNNPTIEQCAVWAKVNPACSDYFEVDPGNNNWCGCGAVNTANAECDEDKTIHASAITYRLTEPKDEPFHKDAVKEQVAGSDSLCRWRQTGGCSPNGQREPNNDKSCATEIQPGSSGYCECGPDNPRVHARSCTDRGAKFTCLEACSPFVLETAEL